MKIEENVREQLFSLKDEGYREFTSKLIPNVDKEKIIGIRSPILKKFAKEYSKKPDSKEFLKILPHRYLEEYGLHSCLLDMEKDYKKVVMEIELLLPFVDNWATCDSIAPPALSKNLDDLLERCMTWIKSDHSYTIRFGVVTLMRYFLDDNFSEEFLYKVKKIKSDDYYVNMAIAWYFSFALIKQYEKTICLIESKSMDKFIQNKSIQKAVESRRISDERKKYLKTLKIK